METRVTEVADGIHQLSTFVGAPIGFNQYLIAADEPLLFHTGMRQMFSLIAAGVSKVLPVESLRWVSFGHVEADESGSMNEWLAVAPQPTIAQSHIGCMVSIEDLADRPPLPLADGEKLDLGGHIVPSGSTRHTCPTRGRRACSTTRPPSAPTIRGIQAEVEVGPGEGVPEPA